MFSVYPPFSSFRSWSWIQGTRGQIMKKDSVLVLFVISSIINYLRKTYNPWLSKYSVYVYMIYKMSIPPTPLTSRGGSGVVRPPFRPYSGPLTWGVGHAHSRISETIRPRVRLLYSTTYRRRGSKVVVPRTTSTNTTGIKDDWPERQTDL